MRKIAVLSLVALLLLSVAAAQPLSYTKLKADAEREYAEKSFSRAHDLYEQAAKVAPDDEKRWVTFRLADTALRAAFAASSELPAGARASLEELIAKTAHDDVWAAANETLADVTREPQWFRAALDYWAGSSDLPRARRHYLDLVWKWVGDDNQIWAVPRDVMVNAVQIAETPQDRARARFILARQYLGTGQPADRERALELLEEIANIGRKSDLYDDALYFLASSQGNDYARALELYRRILREFKEGESEYRDDAQQQIDAILAVNVQASVAGTFVPESEQELYLAWRNVKQIELTVRSVDLTKVSGFRYREWMNELPNDGAVVRRWTYDTNDSGEHIPGSARVPIEPRLPIGAYVLTARGEKESTKQFLLVTDAHIIVHQGKEHVDVFVSDVNTGQPIPNARVHTVQQYESEKYVTMDGQTNADGLARIKRSHGDGAMLITAAAGARQAFHQTWGYWYGGRDTSAQWRIYAFTDRPAYRPNETVQWKMIARIREREQWTTPANAQLDYIITSPRGEKVVKGAATLNAFGAFSGDLKLTESMPLGVYTITFVARGNENNVRGSAQLFRLEEYKLPEFQVKVDTPEGKQYRLGDQIEANIEATYYFGGPVANATVEAVVYQQPFNRWWYPWREYDWYYEPPAMGYGGTVISRQTLTTDASGIATLRIDTPRDGTDSTYRIEARVVDASRREVRGEGSVRVMRQRYSVMAQPEHRVYRPGDSVSVDFKAIDANDKPVQTTGTVKVVRRQWKKRYVDEEVLTTKLTTNAKGEATLTFTPRTTGYYAILWRSEDGSRARDVVTTETAVWVTDRATTELGYRASGLDLILDKDTVRLGDTASLIVVTPASGRWVVFSTGADDLLDTQVIHMDGTAKLVQIPVTQTHVPNFFVTA
ncbi:MAG TPA: MG2 domain-containing protein, partial [Thermoanaerobaculia bacterium]|nr:MG2 domain-containing protein [Thermoanaerobaculia bacterium]